MILQGVAEIMRKSGSGWILLILILSGALTGGIIGEILSGYPFIKWMSLGGADGYRELFSFNFNPLFDASVIRFGFNLSMKVNGGSIIGVLLTLLFYSRR